MTVNSRQGVPEPTEPVASVRDSIDGDLSPRQASASTQGGPKTASRTDRLTHDLIDWEDPGPCEVLAIVQEVDDFLFWVDRCGAPLLYALTASERELLDRAAELIHSVGCAVHRRVVPTYASLEQDRPGQ